MQQLVNACLLTFRLQRRKECTAEWKQRYFNRFIILQGTVWYRKNSNFCYWCASVPGSSDKRNASLNLVPYKRTGSTDTKGVIVSLQVLLCADIFQQCRFCVKVNVPHICNIGTEQYFTQASKRFERKYLASKMPKLYYFCKSP